MAAAEGDLRWLATCPRALAPLLARELLDLGARDLSEQQALVSFSGPPALMYRACLWSRIASRVLLPLGEGPGETGDALYATLGTIDWPGHLAAGATIAVDFNGSNAEIRNTRFGAQRCKDAIVDRFRAASLEPPRVSLENPDIRIVTRLHRGRVEVALDMAGESLHRRGYRRSAGEAPIKENLAAALLYRADWPALAARGAALIDPMCGSATLLVEGAMMAADQAPALGRRRFGFMGWAQHNAAQWQAVHSDARGRAERGRERVGPGAKAPLEIRGYDADPKVVRRAQENIAEAGMGDWVRVSVKALGEVTRPTHRPLPLGLVISNPPYGERLGNKDSLPQLYRRFGELLHEQFAGWQAAILAGDRAYGRALGLRSHRQYSLFNGTLPITLLLLDLTDNRLVDSATPDARHSDPGEGAKETGKKDPGEGQGRADPGPGGPAGAPQRSHVAPNAPAPLLTLADLDPGAAMFANRLRKNHKRLAPWLKRSAVECYRLYDADMPEYAVAIDRYGDWLHVAEYKAPAQVQADAAAQRLQAVRDALPVATGIPAAKIVFKERQRQRGSEQYQRRAQAGEQLSVREGAARLLVNLHDYLDTGLFLDHRPLRLRIAAEARGKRFLNLFCYTGTASVHAALGGARQTVSVDLSHTYLRWLSQNLAHNGLAETHNVLVRADVDGWLKDPARDKEPLFDLILLDPPSFSNSKKFTGSFDVQRDHLPLIEATLRRLAPGGSLYFSTNRRKFRLDPTVSERFSCQDITSKTLDPDFARPAVPHKCWIIRHPPGQKDAK